MEIVSIKFESSFLKTIEKTMKKYNYVTKAEFVREAIRDKIKDLEKEEALIRLERTYGAGANKGRLITSDDLHRVREQAAKEIAKNLGVTLD